MGFLSSQGKNPTFFVVVVLAIFAVAEKSTVILKTVAFSQAVVLFCIVSSLFN